MFYSKTITINMVKINESNARLEVLNDVTTRIFRLAKPFRPDLWLRLMQS